MSGDGSSGCSVPQLRAPQGPPSGRGLVRPAGMVSGQVSHLGHLTARAAGDLAQPPPPPGQPAWALGRQGAVGGGRRPEVLPRAGQAGGGQRLCWESSRREQTFLENVRCPSRGEGGGGGRMSFVAWPCSGHGDPPPRPRGLWRRGGKRGQGLLVSVWPDLTATQPWPAQVTVEGGAPLPAPWPPAQEGTREPPPCLPCAKSLCRDAAGGRCCWCRDAGASGQHGLLGPTGPVGRRGAELRGAHTGGEGPPRPMWSTGPARCHAGPALTAPLGLGLDAQLPAATPARRAVGAGAGVTAPHSFPAQPEGRPGTRCRHRRPGEPAGGSHSVGPWLGLSVGFLPVHGLFWKSCAAGCVHGGGGAGDLHASAVSPDAINRP